MSVRHNRKVGGPNVVLVSSVNENDVIMIIISMSVSNSMIVYIFSHDANEIK